MSTETASEASVPASSSEDRLLLVTGATGFVGSHVADRARKSGYRVRALCRMESDIRLLQKWGVEIVTGSIVEPYSVQGAVRDVTHIVHCAAKIGEWGEIGPYRDVNVMGLEHLLEAAARSDSLRRLVHLSTQGVYPFRDHFGTEESEPLQAGSDPYSITKVEAEQLLREFVRRDKVPAVVLRPGWIYGPRDRTVLPRILERMERGQLCFIGSGEQKLSNTYVAHLVDAIFLALEQPGVVGEAFNITDGRLVDRREFFNTIAALADLRPVTRHVPFWLAQGAATLLAGAYRMLNAPDPPILTTAGLKLLGLNLEFSLQKARRMLGYDPQVDFQEAIQTTMDWFRRRGRL